MESGHEVLMCVQIFLEPLPWNCPPQEYEVWGAGSGSRWSQEDGSGSRSPWELIKEGSSRLLPELLPAPFRLCSRRQPQSSPWDLTSEAQASAPGPRPLWQVSRQASRAGRHRSSVWDSLCFALCTPVAALSSAALKLRPHPPRRLHQ
ncbi:protein cornichon homolog 3 isoform X3 [Physeter macrocephalus]|uniref:Protein cornichon homolog 3 isoform X3 n=1 Tax=Physeter macrocephalus TaxID=9755 RepID=A0A9W2WLJ0_PHYMC|nr:protein cornichon homolog 3 isoform X3 [Physeter catodon]